MEMEGGLGRNFLRKMEEEDEDFVVGREEDE